MTNASDDHMCMYGCLVCLERKTVASRDELARIHEELERTPKVLDGLDSHARTAHLP